MSTRKDHTGKRYGDLTGIRFLGLGAGRSAVWLWQCVCGTTKPILARSVLCGRAKTCGSHPRGPQPMAGVRSYKAAHQYLAYHLGPASQHECADCDNPGQEWSYQGGDPNEIEGPNSKGQILKYSLDPSYYQPLCAPCHREKDRTLRSVAA